MSGSLCISIFICRAILPVQFHALFSQLSPRLCLCSRSGQDTAAHPHCLCISVSLPFLIPTAALLRHSAFWHSRPSQENANEPGADWCRLSSPVTAVLHFLPCFFCPLNVFCNFQNFCSLFEPLSPCFAHGVSGFGQLPSLPCWQWWVCHQ